MPHLRRLKQLEADNARLKRLVAEQMLAHEALRAARRAVGLRRSSQRYQPRDKGERCRLAQEVVALAQQHPRYGYRRITALVRRRGEHVNHKWMWAIWPPRVVMPRVSGH